METESQFQSNATPEIIDGFDFYDEKNLSKELENLFSQEVGGSEKAAQKILSWTKTEGTESDFIRVNRINEFERALGKTLRAKKNLNWSVFSLLAEMEEHKASVYGHLELLQLLGTLDEIFTQEIKTQIETLSKSKDLKDQVLLHKICDLLEALQVTEQFGDFAYDQKVQVRVKEIYEFAKTQTQCSENFLIANHWNNIAQTYEGRHAQKPDIVRNVPGGASDYIITIYNEFVMLQSYYAGVISGKKHFAPEKPLLPIGQKYLASYDKGRVTEFYQQDPELLNKAYQADREMVLLNNPNDNYIYSQLNHSRPQEQSEIVSGFYYKTNKQGRDFYFNVINDDLDDSEKPYTKVLNPQTLHPETLANILAHNYQYLVKSNKLSNYSAKSIAPKEFLKLAFPTGLNNPDKGYMYLYMLGLTARKAVEENLGENLANLPPYGQSALLEYLTSRNKQEFQRVITAGDTWGDNDQNPFRQNFLLSFLSLNENPENQEITLELAEKLEPKISAQVFAKYAEIVKESEKINEYVSKHFGQTYLKERDIQAIVKDIFIKANFLLQNTSKLASNEITPEVLEQLEAFRSEIALYTSVLNELSKEKLISAREEVKKHTITKKSGDFNGEEIKEMKAIFAFGRAEVFPKPLQKQSIYEFERKLNFGEHTFYLLKKDAKIIAFLHTDPVKNPDGTINENAIYVGSLNLSPEGRNGALGVLFVKNLLEEYGQTKDVYADVLEINTRAYKLYTRILGFKQRTDDPYSIINAEDGNRYKNINIVRQRR